MLAGLRPDCERGSRGAREAQARLLFPQSDRLRARLAVEEEESPEEARLALRTGQAGRAARRQAARAP